MGGARRARQSDDRSELTGSPEIIQDDPWAADGERDMRVSKLQHELCNFCEVSKPALHGMAAEGNVVQMMTYHGSRV